MSQVFVPSVQHTGTWFTINFLRRFFPDVRELTFAFESIPKPGAADISFEHKYDHPLGSDGVLHVHLPIMRDPDMDSMAPPETRFHRRWYANLGGMRSLPVSSLLAFCHIMKAVIPLRDPLAAILTREARHPQLRHFFIVDGYIALATEFSKHPNVKFLPIDRATDIQGRFDILAGVAKHVGIDPEENMPFLMDVADSWSVSNDTPGNRFKEAYAAGDIKELQKMLGPKWAEVEYMKNMMSIILPFLAAQGYRREQFIW